MTCNGHTVRKGQEINLTRRNVPNFIISKSASSGGDADARSLVARLKFYSEQFMECLDRGDERYAANHSTDGLLIIVGLFDYFRNENDYGRISDDKMGLHCGQIINKVSDETRRAFVQDKKLDVTHPNYSDASFRDALNKAAHFDGENSSFKIENGNHYLILSAPEPRKSTGFWVIEIKVSDLVATCLAAL